MRLCHWIISIGLLLAACNTSSIHAPPERTLPELGLPNKVLTPGDTLDVTKADICTPGYTKKIRDVPAVIKREIYSSYHAERREGVCCEVDHLIPLELGGSNRVANLWPQRYDGEWSASDKDRLEARLHRLVCTGELDLETAQHAIASDWIAAYKQYVATEPPERRLAPH
jgi:hypothetical protein